MSTRKRFLAWAFLIINILLIINLIRDIIWLSGVDERIKKVQGELEVLKEENFHLNQEKTYRESSEFVEKQIRDKLGMAKPGENVVLLPKEIRKEAEEAEKTAKLTETNNSLPNWQKWLNLFIN